MNHLLHLKGRFEQRTRGGKRGGLKLPSNTSVKVSKLVGLRDSLIELKKFWEGETIISGCLISVHYIKLAAKSNRITGFFSSSQKSPNETIVGAKFSEGIKKHIITHHIDLSILQSTIEDCEEVIKILSAEFNGEITSELFNKKGEIEKVDFNQYKVKKSKFKAYIVDAHYVGRFDIETSNLTTNENAIITLYDVGENIIDILGRLDIRVLNARTLDNTTALLDHHYIEILRAKAPYLVAMATEDITQWSLETFEAEASTIPQLIPSPTTEPTIGVIDTLFDNRVYFSEWVEYHDMVNDNIEKDSNDYNHGTAVSSIIVDGPNINPHLDDGCGRFKVRHFGVATNRSFSSFTIIKAIKEIVARNNDIRVWNLSLGSKEEINQNFISAEAAILDQLQFENDVIFVIAGTNKPSNAPERKIGAPADSINGVVVNSVDKDKTPAPYTRHGLVLSFFTKPDLSYYGGTNLEYMTVCEPLGQAKVSGTSYAAPWIARKLSYLIDVLGLSKEVAKALLIDAATLWTKSNTIENLSMIGYGVVPIDINDVIKSRDDEIKFIINGTSEKYDTYNYNLPIPMDNQKHPYVAKAVLCYFPKCSRNQGVDYTNTELDLYFGRIDNNGKIKSIDNNIQSIEDETHYLSEEDARKLFRKWDNVKTKKDTFNNRTQEKKAYQQGLWGMSIKTKERLSNNDGDGIKFGVVVTLREINGTNRIEDFIQQCSLKGWLVNRIDVENQLDIYQKANEDIHLE
ncbi:S8 family peptidase [Staphylococcus simulans]